MQLLLSIVQFPLLIGEEGIYFVSQLKNGVVSPLPIGKSVMAKVKKLLNFISVSAFFSEGQEISDYEFGHENDTTNTHMDIHLLVLNSCEF